jgi:hypothetical protein
MYIKTILVSDRSQQSKAMFRKVLYAGLCCLTLTGAVDFAAADTISSHDRQLLTTMAAEREIGRLMTDYTWLLDTGDYDGYGQLFASGAFLDPQGKVIAKGSAAVTALVRHYLGNQLGVTVRHVVSSPRIDVDLASGTATASSFLLTVQAPQSQPAYLFRVSSYHDRFQRVGDHWQFRSRQELTDWVLKERPAP